MGCFISKNTVEPAKEKPVPNPRKPTTYDFQMKSVEYQARLRTLNENYKPPIGQTQFLSVSGPHSSPGGMKHRRGSYMPMPFIDLQYKAFESKKFKVMLDQFHHNEED